MKLTQTNDYEVDVVGEVGETGNLEIDTNHLDIWFEMMSKGIYSNPHGSIVRELTSNCFDSHIEAGIDDAVKVGCRYEEGELYMFFEDFGVGINEERFHSVYKKYLSSTKRDTNEQIGGFGLGSKSPLSYTDCFYVRTRKDGREWVYAISKGPNGKPEFDVILNKSTSERNGTEVKFPIEGKVKYSEDWSKFKDEIVNQLRYFDGVYVDGFGIDNEYKIYEFDTFKFRPDTEEEEMHIALGKVSYPINWKTLKRDRIKIPVGVKIEIGEVMVTTNREQIRYSNEVVEVINAKIDACLKELQSLSTYAFEDLNEYMLWKSSRTKYIVTEICQIPMYEGDYGRTANGNIIRYPFSVKAYFKPLGDLPIDIPSDPFFFLKAQGVLSGGSYTTLKTDDKQKMRSYEKVWEIMKRGTKILRDPNFKPNRIRNHYFQSGILVVRKKMSLEDWLTELGLGGIEWYGKNRIKGKRGWLKLDGWNRLKLIQHYRKVMGQEFMNRSVHYSQTPIPQDVIDSFKRKSVKRLVGEGDIAVMDVASDGTSKTVMPFKELEKRLVVYGTNKTKNYLKAVYQVVSGRYDRQPKGFKPKFIAINENEVKLMEGDNKLDLHTYVTKSNLFKEQITAFYLYNRWRSINFDYIKGYIPAVDNTLEEMKDFMYKATRNEYNVYALVEGKFVKELMEMAVSEGIILKDWIDKLEALEAVKKDLKFLKDVFEEAAENEIIKRKLAKFILAQGYQVNHVYLYKPTKTEIRWKETFGKVSNRTLKQTQQRWKKGPYGINHSVNNLKPILCPRTNFLKLEESKSVKISMQQLEKVTNK